MQIVVGVLIVGPLLGLAWFWHEHRNFHLEPPKLNLALYVGLIVIPMIWAALMSATPIEFKKTQEELLGESSFLDTLPMDWWTMFMMWATPFFALGSLGHTFLTKWLLQPQNLSLSPLHALFIMAIIFFLGWFYGVMLLARSEPRTLVSDAGIRTGLIRLHEWRQIHHLSREGDLYALYHQVNPALPASCFRVRTREAQATLERYLCRQSNTHFQRNPAAVRANQDRRGGRVSSEPGERGLVASAHFAVPALDCAHLLWNRDALDHPAGANTRSLKVCEAHAAP